MGASARGFHVRPSVKEQVESRGSTVGGYAKEFIVAKIKTVPPSSSKSTWTI